MPGPAPVATPPVDGAFFLVDLFVNFNTGFVTADGKWLCPRRSGKLPVDVVPDDFVSSISPVLDYFIWWAARGTIVMPGRLQRTERPPSTCDGGAKASDGWFTKIGASSRSSRCCALPN